MEIDFRIVLNRLGYDEGEEQDPTGSYVSYELMVEHWRHSTLPPPTEAECLAEWEIFLAEQAAVQYLRDREAAMELVLRP